MNYTIERMRYSWYQIVSPGSGLQNPVALISSPSTRSKSLSMAMVEKAEELNDQIPLFVKDGALIPMLSKDVLNTEEIQGCDLEVRHYGTIDGTFELYEDDGKSFDYEKGSYRIRSLSVTEQGLRESVRKDDAAAMFGSVSLKRMSRM